MLYEKIRTFMKFWITISFLITVWGYSSVFDFDVITDPHPQYGEETNLTLHDIDPLLYGGSRPMYDKDFRVYTAKAIKARGRGDFLIITGDMDPFSEVKDIVEDVLLESYEASFDNYPLLVAVGNHDIPGSASGAKSSTSGERDEVKKQASIDAFTIENWSDIQELIGFNRSSYKQEERQGRVAEFTNWNWMVLDSDTNGECLFNYVKRDYEYECAIASRYNETDNNITTEGIIKLLRAENPYYRYTSILHPKGKLEYQLYAYEDVNKTNLKMDLFSSYDNSTEEGLFIGSKYTSYSFDYKGLHIVVLDLYSGNHWGNRGNGIMSIEKLKWLQEDLNQVKNRGDIQNILLFGHEPVWTTKEKGKDSMYTEEGILRGEGKGYNMDNGAYQITRGEDIFQTGGLWRVLTTFNQESNKSKVLAYFCGHEKGYHAIKKDGIWEIRTTQARNNPGKNLEYIAGHTKVYVEDENVTVKVYSALNQTGVAYKTLDTILLRGDKNQVLAQVNVSAEGNHSIILSSKNPMAHVRWFNANYQLPNYKYNFKDSPYLSILNNGFEEQNISLSSSILEENKLYHIALEVMDEEGEMDFTTVSIIKDQSGHIVVKDEDENFLLDIIIESVEDSIPPVIQLNGGDIRLIIRGTYTELGAEAIDNRDGDISNDIIVVSDVNTSQVGEYHVHYNVDDSAGNHAQERIRSVSVVEEEDHNHTGSYGINLDEWREYNGVLEEGEITIDGTRISFIQRGLYIIGGKINERNFRWNNKGQKDLSWRMNFSRRYYMYVYIETQEGGIQRIRYSSSSDHELRNTEIRISLGRESDDGVWVDVNRDIEADLHEFKPNDTLIAIHGLMVYSASNGGMMEEIKFGGDDENTTDTTPPSIQLHGGDINLTLGEAYQELGAEASDDRDGNISNNIIIDFSDVNTSEVGAYHVHYNVDDSAGNHAQERIRTVYVEEGIEEDTTPPIIQLNGGDVSLSVGESYQELGAEASDDRDGDISNNIIIDSSDVNTSEVGTYHVRYNVDDSVGNHAQERIRSVHILEEEDENSTTIGYYGTNLSEWREYNGVLEEGEIMIDGTRISFNQKGLYIVGGKEQEVNFRWNNRSKKSLSWKMNFSQRYYIYLYIETQEGGIQRIRYSSSSDHELNHSEIRIPLGRDSDDGVWVDVNRDIEADLHEFKPNDTLIAIHGLMVYSASNGGMIEEINFDGENREDSTPPIIQLNGGDVSLSVGESYQELGATANDDRDGDISNNIVIDSDVNTSEIGAYHVHYNVDDSAGNHAQERIRNVHVRAEQNSTGYYGTNLDEWREYNGVLEEGEITIDGTRISFIQKGLYIVGGKEQEINFRWNNRSKKSLSWQMNFSQRYYIYVYIETQEGGIQRIRYSSSSDHELKNTEIRISLGRESDDGVWVPVSRDIEADLHEFKPNDTLIAIHGIMIYSATNGGMIEEIEFP